MRELPGRPSIAALKAKILATKVTGEFSRTISSGKFSYDELVRLFIGLKDRKIRRFNRRHPLKRNIPTCDGNPELPLVYTFCLDGKRGK